MSDKTQAQAQAQAQAPGFILINPYQREVTISRFPSYREAIASLGVNPLELDHTTITQTETSIYGMFLYELGLKQPLKPNGYWALNRQLLNGSAVIYGEEKEKGGNIDLYSAFGFRLARHLKSDYIKFLGDELAAEAAIAQNLIDRPQTTFSTDGGKTITILWEWNK